MNKVGSRHRFALSRGRIDTVAPGFEALRPVMLPDEVNLPIRKMKAK